MNNFVSDAEIHILIIKYCAPLHNVMVLTFLSAATRRYFTFKFAILFFFTIIVINIAHSLLRNEDWKVFFTFLILVPVYFFFGIFYGPVEIGLGLLVIGAVELSIGNDELSNELSIYSYWLLLDGILLLLLSKSPHLNPFQNK
jgi:hypothetical protein